MIDYLNSLSWSRYWMAHVFVSLAISIFCVVIDSFFDCLGGTAAFTGPLFYLGRELRDVEKLHAWNWRKFDFKGFFYPLISSVLLFILLRIIHRHYLMDLPILNINVLT